jgi:hypothetical protein
MSDAVMPIRNVPCAHVAVVEASTIMAVRQVANFNLLIMYPPMVWEGQRKKPAKAGKDFFSWNNIAENQVNSGVFWTITLILHSFF